MPLSGVRSCAGTVLSALHFFLIRRTPPDESLQAIAAQARPIPGSAGAVGGLERSGKDAVTLSTGIRKEFRQFVSPFLFCQLEQCSRGSRETMCGVMQNGRHPTIFDGARVDACRNRGTPQEQWTKFVRMSHTSRR